MLAKILLNGAHIRQKLTPVSHEEFTDSHEEFRKLQTSSEKSEKLKFNGLLLFKNTFLQL